jgi:hypothetical protein
MRKEPSRSGRRRWYGSVRIARDGRPRFSALAFKNAGHVTISYRPSSIINVFVRHREVMLLYPWPRRIVSACFIYTLTAEELCDAVETLRNVTGGLEGWIVPALEWTQKDLAGAKRPRPNWPDLVAVIPHLLEFCRDLPVSPVWQRHRRATQQAWAKHLETHPEELPLVAAPWMLPDGYNPSLMPSTKPPAATAARRANR